MSPKGERVILLDSDGVPQVGEVQDIPTEFTLLRRLRDIFSRQGDGVQKTQLVDSSGNVIGSLNNALNIHNTDVHTKVISRHFLDFDGATEPPSSSINSGDTLISVASTTGFIVGDDIVIRDAGGDIREHHFTLTAVDPDVSMSTDRPIDLEYTTSAVIEKVGSEMNVSGSLGTPIIYEIGPPSDEIWHVQRLMFSITDNTVGQFDDSKFGSLAALSNGVVLRENKSEKYTIENWKSNAEMIITMFDVVYSGAAPAGNEGLRARFSFSRADSIVKLDGSADETIQLLIQDNLSTLTGFKAKIQGHIEGQS